MLDEAHVEYDAFSFLNSGELQIKRSYYYRSQAGDLHALQSQLINLFPAATNVHIGEHHRAFHGGAKPGSANDSYLYVSLMLPDSL